MKKIMIRVTLAAMACLAMPLAAVAQHDLQQADSIVKYQMKSGGWPKNQDWLKGADQAYMRECRKSGVGSTIDNGATVAELRALAKACATIDDLTQQGIRNLDMAAINAKRQRYVDAFMQGLDYLLDMQYDNGGWPQFYPARKEAPYSSQITFNDGAFVNVMRLMCEIRDNSESMRGIKMSTKQRRRCGEAVEKGLRCILDCQIRVDDNGRVLAYGSKEWAQGKRTVWAQQHDKKTLAPCQARAYELAAYCGHGETVEVMMFLMENAWHREEAQVAVSCAVEWLQEHAIKGKRVEDFLNEDGKMDRRVVDDDSAPQMWARLYDLQKGEPLYCGRDGVAKSRFADIDYDRRNGYQWLGYGPQKAIDKFKSIY